MREGQIKKPGREHTGPVWEVRRDYLEGHLAAVRDPYGSIDSYQEKTIELTDEIPRHFASGAMCSTRRGPMLFEIRSYHYDPDKWDAYKPWAQAEAIPYLKAHWDIVGFWFDSGDTPEFRGQDPEPRKYGAANITWIIRWESMEQRNQAHKDLRESEAWRQIWSTHPDPNGYLHMEVRFAEEV